MSGIKQWRTISGKPPTLKEYFVRASQTIDEMDILALMADTTTQRVIKATSTELDFQNASVVAGLLGMAWYPVKTDANGVLGQNIPSTVDPGAAVYYGVPTYSNLIDRPVSALIGTTPDIGNARVLVAIFDSDVEFLIDVAGSANANVTVTQTLVGKMYGLQVASGVFKVNTAVDVSVSSGIAAGVIVASVDDTQPNFNASANTQNAVWVRLRDGYRQYETGQTY